jgi:hypothetical protein
MWYRNGHCTGPNRCLTAALAPRFDPSIAAALLILTDLPQAVWRYNL